MRIMIPLLTMLLCVAASRTAVGAPSAVGFRVLVQPTSAARKPWDGMVALGTKIPAEETPGWSCSTGQRGCGSASSADQVRCLALQCLSREHTGTGARITVSCAADGPPGTDFELQKVTLISKGGDTEVTLICNGKSG